MEEAKNQVLMGINRLIIVANSKREVYKLLKYTEKYYLSPLSHSDANYIHDILADIKRVLAKYEYLL